MRGKPEPRTLQNSDFIEKILNFFFKTCFVNFVCFIISVFKAKILILNFDTNGNVEILKTIQRDEVNLWYFKFRLFKQTGFIVGNIKGL